MDDNIIRLAELQDSGELPPAAEESLALAYAERHAHGSRYVAAFGRWMHYDGTRWDFDNTLRAFDRARAICREVAADCNKAKVATAIASAKTVAAVERLAKADRRLAATTDQWDVDPWLLQDDGMTIELRTALPEIQPRPITSPKKPPALQRRAARHTRFGTPSYSASPPTPSCARS